MRLGQFHRGCCIWFAPSHPVRDSRWRRRRAALQCAVQPPHFPSQLTPAGPAAVAPRSPCLALSSSSGGPKRPAQRLGSCFRPAVCSSWGCYPPANPDSHPRLSPQDGHLSPPSLESCPRSSQTGITRCALPDPLGYSPNRPWLSAVFSPSPPRLGQQGGCPRSKRPATTASRSTCRMARFPTVSTKLLISPLVVVPEVSLRDTAPPKPRLAPKRPLW